jgi:phage-related protein
VIRRKSVYTVRIVDSVHVLHAFQKKSKTGIETPKPDVDLIERRPKAVLDRHRSREGS